MTQQSRIYFVISSTILLILCMVLYTFYSGSLKAFTKRYKELWEKQQQNIHFVPSNEVLSFRDGNFSMNNKQELLNYIRGHIIGPSAKGYNLQHSSQEHFSQAGQDRFVDETLHKLKGGFFVECGAAGGEFLSNTLYLERVRNWTGLLIEANPYFYSELLRKQRKAYSLNGCLSVGNLPKLMKFRAGGLLGGISGTMDDNHLKAMTHIHASEQEVEVQCFPLNFIMEALGRNHINYLSLDVEGPELDVLKTIQWNTLRIDLISVEYRIWDGKQYNLPIQKVKLDRIRNFMMNTAIYEEADILPKAANSGNKEASGLDVVFKRRDLHV